MTVINFVDLTDASTRSFAQKMDTEDPLREFRDAFYFPKDEAGKTLTYLCGNSLGLQPKRAREIVQEEFEDWARLGVEGHFHGRRPWVSYHQPLAPMLADIVGAKEHEVVAMNSLTTNLHLLMATFYRPTKTRYKIVIEKAAFPSDQYAVASQAIFHGLDPKTTVVELAPREGEKVIRTEDIEKYLEEDGESVALVMFGGINYYTGQAFDFPRIVDAGHKAGAIVGFDLAHAMGNLELKLHEWNVDFAVWCSYKYLNSGPGSVGGAYIHERFADNPDLPRFAGWWGNDPETRFEMKDEFIPAHGANGWQLSNAPVFTMAIHLASLELFAKAGMSRLRKKSVALTEYLLFLIDSIPQDKFEIITPRDPKFRGSQISIRTRFDGRTLFDKITESGVICDFRNPDVIRIAPTPMYNSFEDVWVFVNLLKDHA